MARESTGPNVTDDGEVSRKDPDNWVQSQSDQYEECDVCGGQIDTFDAGYFKSHDDTTFRHELCHEHGEPPEQFKLAEASEFDTWMSRQYNCGHLIHAPPKEWPMFCPICNDLDIDVEPLEEVSAE